MKRVIRCVPIVLCVFTTPRAYRASAFLSPASIFSAATEATKATRGPFGRFRLAGLLRLDVAEGK
jgi:hypothetical protein